MHVQPLTQAFDLLNLHRLDPARYPVLLESSASGAHGRWDMLLAHAGDVCRRLRRQADGRRRSCLILSGLLAADVPGVVRRYADELALPMGVEPVQTTAGDWHCLRFVC